MKIVPELGLKHRSSHGLTARSSRYVITTNYSRPRTPCANAGFMEEQMVFRVSRLALSFCSKLDGPPLYGHLRKRFQVQLRRLSEMVSDSSSPESDIHNVWNRR
ncbi:hypothetical protein CEXT_642661 [Caerostris extrusa]|uniref:Uncharacterized protein n=1 Tax=Caerostris extrusa TaxID=172846 RepID=A0AAV4RCU1_CAEEX|nr:hypothetical protein CEXT_642661 [Caerostris extrusa]